ncbi:hypothetical protein [Brevundimonas sp. SL161]|uniref:hypothetical protein n=1 Tax=Brevundimonas sp. SL161 TaxID=2804613 RepID=UPI003CE9BB57
MPTQTQNNPSVASLAASFMAMPAASGDYAADNRQGHGHADALIEVMRDAEVPGLLGHVIKAVGASGRWSGVEIGFAHRLAEYALAGR